MRIIKRLFLCCSPMGLSMACYAADALPPGVPSQGPQVMIYFRQPLWSPGTHRTYGLRIDQTSMPSAAPTSLGINPLRRREIVNFEIGQHSDMRVEFARRLVWDVNRQELGLGSTQPSLIFHLQPRIAASLDSTHPHP
jgi:hypothetical protein